MSVAAVTPADVLALFVRAGRVHYGLSPATLEKRLELPPGTVAHVESRRPPSRAKQAKRGAFVLAAWCGIEGWYGDRIGAQAITPATTPQDRQGAP